MKVKKWIHCFNFIILANILFIKEKLLLEQDDYSKSDDSGILNNWKTYLLDERFRHYKQGSAQDYEKSDPGSPVVEPRPDPGTPPDPHV